MCDPEDRGRGIGWLHCSVAGLAWQRGWQDWTYATVGVGPHPNERRVIVEGAADEQQHLTTAPRRPGRQLDLADVDPGEGGSSPSRSPESECVRTMSAMAWERTGEGGCGLRTKPPYQRAIEVSCEDCRTIRVRKLRVRPCWWCRSTDWPRATSPAPPCPPSPPSPSGALRVSRPGRWHRRGRCRPTRRCCGASTRPPTGSVTTRRRRCALARPRS